jgi:hypothetical protein
VNLRVLARQLEPLQCSGPSADRALEAPLDLCEQRRMLAERHPCCVLVFGRSWIPRCPRRSDIADLPGSVTVRGGVRAGLGGDVLGGVCVVPERRDLTLVVEGPQVQFLVV